MQIKRNLQKKAFIKNLNYAFKNSTGKNNLGLTTVFHKGGGVKKKFRSIDFKKRFINVEGLVLGFEYDNFRKNDLSIVNYDNGVIVFNIKIKYLQMGHSFFDFADKNFYGATYYLKQLPIGTYISLLEFAFNKGLQMIRAAGTKGQILGKNENLVSIKLPSGEIRKFLNNCKAVLGTIDENLKKTAKILKAGRNRLNNKRPVVRGVAMNPIDHPHGGGQGKTSGGRKMSVSPWAKYTKGLKPKKRKRKKIYNF
jgi:large subunit ribosomal protein L2